MQFIISPLLIPSTKNAEQYWPSTDPYGNFPMLAFNCSTASQGSPLTTDDCDFESCQVANF